MASNTFITKIFEECAKCKDFIDRNAIKTLRFKAQSGTLSIYDAIKLSTIKIAMDWELLTAALSFWCSVTNTMVLPLGPIGPTVLNISVILGTSPYGLPVDVVLPGYQFNLDLKALFEERRGQVKFQERCTKLRLRSNVLETHSTDTFAEWWDAYVQEFFSTPVEDVVKKIFDDHPKKAPRPTKWANTTATVTTKKKPAPLKKTAIVQAPAASPTLVAATIVPASARELQNPPMAQATKVQPTIPAVIQPIVAPLVEVPITPKLAVTPTIGLVTAAIRKAATMAEKNPPPNPKKKTIIIVEEEPMVETAGEVNPLAIEANEGHEVMPAIKIEATTETPIHSQYQNLGISPQEVTSAFCLNDLVAGGLLSTESVTHLSNLLERSWHYFTTFEKALRAKDNLKAAKTAHETGRPEIEAIKTKKTWLADLDHQIAELQQQRWVVVSDPEKNFEANKARLTDFVASIS
ncbi:hypothetical protein D8674_020547 [Pyrus ussuriensis x Pyrus communis]|uniref:Aminotransferase-like plant mobile domain-containing protein n=1 Tax=Pyrus ussuriensis x Pyrus communis TaxID=2448454 RepID=A0A5N5HFY6_9ROSA|nr:hypothetical protein D8674_020547 [Pyrus ussuriensis x Pyrus communis]